MSEALRRIVREGLYLFVALLIAALGVGSTVHLAGFQFEMPDPSEMSGIPLPSGDLPNGAVSVRVIRGQLANNVIDHPVELVGADETVTVSTDEFGRAQFTGVPGGTLVRAVTDVDGRRIESQPFPVPTTGGIRVMLVAPEEGSETPAAESAAASAGAGVGAGPTGAGPTGAGPTGAGPAGAGTVGSGPVAFGGETRFIVELGEDNLEMYYLLDIMNPGATAVTPETPIIFDLPSDAVASTILQGSSPQARLNGQRIEVTGPLQPGVTHLEVAYFLPYGNGNVTVSQQLPAALSQLSLLAQKHGGAELSSPQIQNRREMVSQGRTYIVANGPGLTAGSTLTLSLTGLPHHSTLPSTIAVILVLSIMGVGFWVAMGPGDPSEGARRRKLEAKRDMLFGTLVRIEEERRDGAIDEARYAGRRRELIAQLERVYRDLDNPRAA